jgi:hypothetical protein
VAYAVALAGKARRTGRQRGCAKPLAASVTIAPVASGKRVGPRQRRATFRPALAVLALGVTACVVAWGYLVWAAIDFGAAARGGDGDAWKWLVVASLGAVACLFAGLMLVARLLRALGITDPPPKKERPEQRSGHSHAG